MINDKDTAPNNSSLFLIFKILRKDFKESFIKYVSGLIKILIKGISIAKMSGTEPAVATPAPEVVTEPTGAGSDNEDDLPF